MILKDRNNVFTYEHTYKKGWEKWYFLCSDIHYDSKGCQRKKLTAHFDLAKERDATIFIFGDLVDAMGGKFDKRTSKADIREEYNIGSYFNLISKDIGQFLAKYVDNIGFISEGNHCTSVNKIHEIDILEMINNEVYSETQKRIALTNYAGWVRFLFSYGSKGMRKSFRMKFHHGFGGSSPVTRGVINTNRNQVNYVSDFFVTGHIHQSWHVSIPQIRLSDSGREIVTNCEHIQLGTYKSESTSKGWGVEKGFSPPALGAYFLRFYTAEGGLKYQIIKAD